MRRSHQVRQESSFLFARVLLLLVVWNSGCGTQTPPRSKTGSDATAESARAINEIPLGEPLSVRITGHDFQWRIRYPGTDGILDTPDDVLGKRNLHLPEKREICLELCSDDFAYTLFVPHYDFLDVAMPGSPFEFDFTTQSTGDHKLLGSQMCGYTHPLLIGRLIIHTKTDFESWLASQ